MRTVAIVGGGASGTLLASLLVARSEASSVVIIDPCEQLGRRRRLRDGLHAPHAQRSGRKDCRALTTDRDHFVRWLAANFGDTYDPSSFVPRSLYGDYLGDIATEARAAEPDRWRHVPARPAREVREEHDGVYVTCSNGEVVEADRLVLATGNAAPAAWPNMSPEARHSQRYFGSTWEPGALAPTSAGETVVLLGTGLTAIDALFGLRDNGHRGPTYMVSRRGLLPQEHRASNASAATVLGSEYGRRSYSMRCAGSYVTRSDPARIGAASSTPCVRTRTHSGKRFQSPEQRRFLRHALPYWNVHRASHAAASVGRHRRLDRFENATRTRGAHGRNHDGRRRSSRSDQGARLGRVLNDRSRPPHQLQRSRAKRPEARECVRAEFARARFDDAERPSVSAPVSPRTARSPVQDGTGIDNDYSRSAAARFGTLIETTGMREIREQAQELAELLSAG